MGNVNIFVGVDRVIFRLLFVFRVGGVTDILGAVKVGRAGSVSK